MTWRFPPFVQPSSILPQPNSSSAISLYPTSKRQYFHGEQVGCREALRSPSPLDVDNIFFDFPLPSPTPITDLRNQIALPMNIRHFLFLPLLASAAAEPLTIRDTSEATSKTTDLTIVKGSVDLPRKGSWTARKLYGHQGGLTEIYLFNDDDPSANDGRRSALLKDSAAPQDRSGKIWSIYWNCRSFAEEGDGLAPTALVGLKNRSNREEVSAKDAAGIHLIPGIRILKKVDDKMVRVDKAETLLIDLTPAIDDGKHWILDSHGRAKREEIDSARMKALGLTVRPQAKSHLTRLGTAKPTITYTVLARRTGAADTSTFTVDNITTKASLEVTWDTKDPAKGDQSLCTEWAKLRLDCS